jgi:hypothetical protein
MCTIYGCSYIALLLGFREGYLLLQPYLTAFTPTLDPLKGNPYKTSWALNSKKATGFPTEREAQLEKGQHKHASGVEAKDGRFYVMKVAR